MDHQQKNTEEKAMRTVFRWLILVGIVLQFLVPSAYAGWKNRVAANEQQAAEYISQLEAGAPPGSIERPILRHIDRYQAKQEKKRFDQAMDEAEALARAGRRDQIRALELEWDDLQPSTSSY
jgi:hypothetical protein